MSSFSSRLLNVIAAEEPELRALPEETSNAHPDGSWSRKQELGHLIDSVTNNRVRIVTAALEGRYTGPEYDGRGWVDLGGYAETGWAELVGLWRMLNRALAVALERIPAERLASECRVAHPQAMVQSGTVQRDAPETRNA